MRRIGGVACQAGHASHAVILGKIRFEGPVVDRPVIRHSIQRPHAEIGRMHARVVCREENRPAAGAVEVGNLHRGVVVVDRIIRVPRPAVGANVEIGVVARLPVTTVAREFG